jgi:CRISPR-associated DxTHG motif protein
MKLITFLGTTEYRTTLYVLGEQSHETQFFPVALARFIRPAQVLVCVTPTVQQHHNLLDLGQQLGDTGVPWESVPIPEGHSEADLWSIFDALTSAVGEGEHVTFDVTHSFRSLPILAFLAIAYLKAAKRVSVDGVLYGAWEARDTTTNHTPVFDLTPFVALLDWLTATNRFVETGDGHALANLLKTGMPAGPVMRDDIAARALGRNLKAAADAIESVSLALQVTRPMEAMQAAAQLRDTLRQALPGILERARPFGVITEQVTQAYGQFALEAPTEAAALSEGLRQQLQMIDWYVKRRRVVQAATLAREWVVSALVFQFNQPMFDYDKGRHPVEQALNNAVEKRKLQARNIQHTPWDALLEQSPQIEALVKVWSQLADLRNDIAHVGMKIAPKPAALLKQKVEAIYPQLMLLAQQWGLA